MDSLPATGNNKYSCRGGSRRRSHVAIFYIDSRVAWSSNWGNGTPHWVPAAISDAWIDDVTRDFIEPLELHDASGAHDDDGGSTKIHHQKISNKSPQKVFCVQKENEITRSACAGLEWIMFSFWGDELQGTCVRLT